jgi:hypothetical protein
MLRDEGLSDFGCILGCSLAVLEPYAEARVVNCKAFGLIELPACLPQRGFRTHLQMVVNGSARGALTMPELTKAREPWKRVSEA